MEHIHYGAQYAPNAFNLHGYPALKSFTSSDKNYKIKIVDNVVYSHDGKKLIMCRKGIEGCFSIPEGVEIVASYAFAHCLKLTGVVFHSTLFEIELSAFQGCAQLIKVYVSENVKSTGDAEKQQLEGVKNFYVLLDSGELDKMSK